jgi:hypothetical protein
MLKRFTMDFFYLHTERSFAYDDSEGVDRNDDKRSRFN